MRCAAPGMYCLLRSRPSRLRPRILQPIRLQHGGPHKEYFQNPRQMPLPETDTLSNRLTHPGDFPRKSTLMRRLWNSAGLALWSLLFGISAGSSLITWAYLQGPFEAGTDEEKDMLEEITSMINDHPATEGLLNDPEWEEIPVAPRVVSGDAGKGLSFVTGTLSGSKGIRQVFCSMEAFSYIF